MKQLFLDVDGVFADFDLGYWQRFGHWPDQVDDDTMWANINTVKDTFFAELPVFPGALLFYSQVKRYSPVFLTACSAVNFETVANQKKHWLRKHVDPDAVIIPVHLSKFKHVYVQNKGDVLIDDFERNIERWNDAGGEGLLHHSNEDFDTHVRDLRYLMR